MANVTTSFDHPLRRALNDEVHARPPDVLPTPCSVSFVTRTTPDDAVPNNEVEVLADLLRRFDSPAPEPNVKHFAAQLPEHGVRWERHTEFSRYAFIRTLDTEVPFANPPTQDVPQDWLASLSGNVMTATHVSIVRFDEDDLHLGELSVRYFDGNTLIGSQIAGGRALAITDFHIQKDGFTRLLVINDAMPPAQTGRLVQRLLEIDAYRMMALLALPVAQGITPKLNASERQLVGINESLVAPKRDDEAELLAKLTTLAAENQGRHMRSDFRFAAANAYYEIVLQRIAELREARIPDLQTFEEFTKRRLTPAIKTCHAVAKRQQSLVLRMARATQLLSTRVDVERQAQNQLLLESMNRRAKSQLRLQATVEGLSVAAVTYYVVGLVSIIAKGLESRGYSVDPALAAAVSVPLVAIIAFSGIRRLRRHLSEEEST